MIINSSDLFYLCSLIEYIGRKQKLERKSVAHYLGEENIDRIYRTAEVLHCESIDKTSDEYISYCSIPRGSYDNQKGLHQDPLGHWDNGRVYQQLIEDTFSDDDLARHIIKIYESPVSALLCNYDSGLYKQSRESIKQCYCRSKQ